MPIHDSTSPMWVTATNAHYRLTSPTLITLGEDTIINILDSLSPIDVISTRKTCKSLRDATYKRIVWINALRKVMKKYSITEASYPLKEMSTDLLQRVALSPERLVSLAKKHDKGQIEPRSVRFLPLFLQDDEKKKYGIQTLGDMYDMILLMGGRFLATLSTDPIYWPGSSLMIIWDLGLEGTFVPLPLAKSLQPHSDLSLRLFFQDPLDIAVFYTVSVRQESTTIKVFVHRVSLTSDVNMTFIASIGVPTSTDHCLVHLLPQSHKITVSTHYNGKYSIFIWDFANQTGATLIGPSFALTEEAQVFPCDDFILLTWSNRMKMYNIPVLDSLQPGQRPSEYEAKANFCLPLKSEESFFIPYNNVTPIIPIKEFHSAFYLFLLDMHQLNIIQVKDVEPSQSPVMADERLSIESCIEVSDARLYAAIKGGGTMGNSCAGNLSMTHLDETGAYISVFDTDFVSDPEGNIDLGFLNARMIYPCSVDVTLMKFSAILNRNCLLTNQGDIVVLDF